MAEGQSYPPQESPANPGDEARARIWANVRQAKAAAEAEGRESLILQRPYSEEEDEEYAKAVCEVLGINSAANFEKWDFRRIDDEALAQDTVREAEEILRGDGEQG